jgi:hypothetical protein
MAREDDVYNGYFIPKGAIVLVNIRSVHLIIRYHASRDLVDLTCSPFHIMIIFCSAAGNVPKTLEYTQIPVSSFPSALWSLKGASKRQIRGTMFSALDVGASSHFTF